MLFQCYAASRRLKLICFRTAATGPAGYSDSAVGSPSLRSRENSTRGQAASQSPPPSRQGRGQSASNRPPSHNLSPSVHGRDAYQTPPNRSPAQSRAASPLRIFHTLGLHRNHTRDEPFIPVDPFSSHIRWFGLRREHSPNRPFAEFKPNLFCTPFPFPCPIGPRSRKDEDEDEITTRKKRPRWRMFVNEVTLFGTYIFPRMVYLYFLLHLPALYWQRVARVFEDAEVSKPEIQRLIDACGHFSHDPSIDAAIASGFVASPTPGPHRALSPGIPFPEEWTPPAVSPSLARFKLSWETFVDSLLREWKTFNLVSALLLA